MGILCAVFFQFEISHLFLVYVVGLQPLLPFWTQTSTGYIISITLHKQPDIILIYDRHPYADCHKQLTFVPELATSPLV
jgi:hypothetical protein